MYVFVMALLCDKRCQNENGNYRKVKEKYVSKAVEVNQVIG